MIFIEKDLFNIATRLRSINKNYFLFYNARRSQFEVYLGKNTFATNLCFTFKTLDASAIEKANKTKIENIDKLLKQMDDNNKKIQNSAIHTYRQEVAPQLEDMLEFASTKEHTVDFSKNVDWF